jgi:putative transcriptional regulator
MNIQHHLSDDLLLDYAAGNLSEGWSLVVATHMALCPSCRRRLSAMEGAAGALLDKVEPADLPVDAWDSVGWKASKSRRSKLQGPRRLPPPARCFRSRCGPMSVPTLPT